MRLLRMAYRDYPLSQRDIERRDFSNRDLYKRTR